jgi:polar amino acid transport system permease protein
MISMLKYSSVIFLIGVPDLMGQAKILSSQYFDPISVYLTAAVFYLVLVGIATIILNTVGGKLATPGLELELERH